MSRENFEYEAGKALNLPTNIIELARKGDGYDHAFDSMNIMQPLNGWWHWWKAGAASMQSERDQLAAQLADVVAENAGLLPKAASELSNAWVLHKYLIGIQAAIMYLDNGNKKAAQEWLYGTIAGPGFEFPDEVEDIDAWATHQMRGSISHPRALEIIKAETPATDRFIAEQRASAVDEVCLKISNAIVNCYQDEQVGLDAAETICGDFAAQLRNEVK
ncbi:hypothetical protein [Siccibacter turicensis]|uniref:hypothetical protein n=1 Tax=Siccibacter turicensis TaxID=357233 RepID=UPI0023F1C62D|nr:hypothetical protein [Siccibacter turicensis]